MHRRPDLAMVLVVCCISPKPKAYSSNLQKLNTIGCSSYDHVFIKCGILLPDLMFSFLAELSFRICFAFQVCSHFVSFHNRYHDIRYIKNCPLFIFPHVLFT